MPRKIIHQESWSQSVEGFPIEMYKKVHTPGSVYKDQKPILFIGGVHGDEPEGVRLAEELLGWLEVAAETEDLLPWILIPCLNIDGYKKNQRVNGRGVDLNRNFPTKHWKISPEKNRYYTGPLAASELEVRSLIKLVDAEKPQLIVHFHSWEPCVVFTGHPGEKWAQTLSIGNGYPVKEDIGYPTPGSLGEWGWLERSTPVICIEEKEHIDLNLVWPHFESGLKKILRGQVP